MSPKLQEIASRLRDAQLRLELARNYLKEVISDRVGGIDEADAYRQAVNAETSALRNYAKILREYEECLKQQEQRSKGQGA